MKLIRKMKRLIPLLAGLFAGILPAFQGARMTVEDSLYEEIHLGTGWPIDYTFTRETFIELDGQQQTQLVETNIRIIVEE